MKKLLASLLLGMALVVPGTASAYISLPGPPVLPHGDWVLVGRYASATEAAQVAARVREYGFEVRVTHLGIWYHVWARRR